MARYSDEVKAAVQKQYCTQFSSITELSKKFKIPHKTLYRWRDDGKWDEPICKQAKQMYVDEQAKLPAIAKKLRRSIAQIKQWQKDDNWDEELTILGDIGLSRTLLVQIKDDIKKAIQDGTISEPGTADKITKSLAIVKHLMPKRIQLANIFQLLKDLTGFVTTLGDDDFAKLFQKYLPEMADYLRGKYAE
jgi:uncharacterized protein YjcR